MTAGAGEARVDVFFYGSFMSLDVLRRYGLEPTGWRTGVSVGHRLVFTPLATLERAAGEVVYGIVCSLTHGELRALYGQGWLGAYQPEAILVQQTTDGTVSPALCFIAHGPTAPRPSADYVSVVVDAARRHRFPEWYVAQIASAGALADERAGDARDR
jgi:hypothetical protein